MSDIQSVYVHVPFCVKKCGYCDFYSLEDLSLIPDYGRALCREIALAAPHPRASSLDTLYFGGGTPSLIPLSLLETILLQLEKHHGLDGETEITLEVNPGTVDLDYFKGLRGLGVNRLSLGIQSFDPQRLKFLSRIHSVDQAAAAIGAARKAGFDNLGLDLIYGLPLETRKVREAEMDRALAFAPEHLSCYMLTLEPGTPLSRQWDQGAFIPMDGEDRSQAFVQVSQYLEARGYAHYEISNFARQGFHSRHNSAYWKMIPYRGYGPAAHSLVITSQGEWQRSWNAAHARDYIGQLDGGQLPPREREILTRDQKKIEMIMVGLRTRRGVDISAYDRILNADFKTEFKSLLGNLCRWELGRFRGGCFHLTRAGWTRLDNIVESFFDLI
ncbi:MAG: radical SAM family heme chaperone HemW [Desulfobacterales bacterium]|nr:radical SAM family heme chaperone HemW [Desulfobacterales bacterium]